jgi:hypothetical protein
VQALSCDLPVAGLSCLNRPEPRQVADLRRLGWRET